MALTSSSTQANALAQYNNNLDWEGDITKATDALEAVRWLLVNRPATLSKNDRTVNYDFSELNELTLAYAISVHKSQGSEYPAVIIPIMTQHFALLQRNLLYPAMTRGKKLVILVGTKKALDIALKNDTPRRRNSRLAARLINK